MSGLACALRLRERGVECLVLEGADAPGGRARTDRVDGFLLDRGFQVLLTAYPEVRRLFDLKALDLRRFEPGALIWYDGRFHRLADPWRRPWKALAGLFNPVGGLADKLRVADVRRRVRLGTLEELFQREQASTLDYLRGAGFGEAMIERFFRPFLGGIFLEPELATSSRVFEFVFRMFAEGDAAVPGAGMGELARQLAGRLPGDALRTGARVERVEEGTVTLASGERIRADAVVVATDGPEAGSLVEEAENPPGRAVTCLYFAADCDPMAEPVLVLNGEGPGAGPVNNLAVMNRVAPGYAPEGSALVSATVLGDPEADDDALEASVRGHLTRWFGNDVAGWRHLRTYRIFHALPDQSPDTLEPVVRPVRVRSRLFVCGDHRETGSLQGALSAGRRAADAVAGSLAR